MSTFRPFSIVHALVLLTFAATVTGLVLTRRRLCRIAPARADAFDRNLGIIATVIWLFTTLVQFLPRYYDRTSSLPLHVCDFTIMAVPLALSRGKLDYYLLPLLPPASLVVGRHLSADWDAVDRAWARAALVVFALVALGPAALQAQLGIRGGRLHLEVQLHQIAEHPPHEIADRVRQLLDDPDHLDRLEAPELVLERRLLDAAQLDAILSVDAMTRGGIVGKAR